VCSVQARPGCSAKPVPWPAVSRVFADEVFQFWKWMKPASKLYTRMVESLASKKWDGERDSWAGSAADARIGRRLTQTISSAPTDAAGFQPVRCSSKARGRRAESDGRHQKPLIWGCLAICPGGGAILPARATACTSSMKAITCQQGHRPLCHPHTHVGHCRMAGANWNRT